MLEALNGLRMRQENTLWQQRWLTKSPADPHENHKLELSRAWEPGDNSCLVEVPA